MSSSSAGRTTLAVLLVAIVGVSIVAGAGVGGQAPATDTPAPLDAHTGASANATSPADEVHVSDDGEVVMVYDGNATGDVTEAEFGVDVATGLANAMLVSNANTSGTNGNLSAVLTSGGISGAGDVSIDETANLTALDASANLTRTDTENSFDASVVAATDMSAQTPGSLETNGSVVVAPDAFRMNANVSSEQPTLPVQSSEAAATIRGTDTGYTVSVEEVRPRANETRWGTEEAANQTLTAQFDAIATQFDGSSQVSIHAHSFTDTPVNNTLDINYTVTLTDVKTGIANSVVEGVANDSAVELTDEERAALVDAVTNVSVDEIAVQQSRTGEANTAAASVRISNYQEAVIGFMEITANRSASLTEADIDRYRDTVEARQAANLVQETTWDASLSGSAEETSIEFDVASNSQNWSAYVSELEARGIEQSTNVTASMSAELVGDAIDVEADFEIQRADLVGDALSAVGAETDSTGDDQATRLLRALQDSEFETARGDVSLAEGTVELRAGASFDNASELRSATAELFGDTTVAQMYGQSDADGSATYVYLGDAYTVSELEQRGLVDDDTEVVEGSNVSQFPRMNTTAAAQYLGVEAPSDGDNETTTPTPTPTPGDGETATPTPDGGDGETATPTPDGGDGDTVAPGQPGFGTVVAVLAVVLAGLLVARRR
jgi:hypothetical protein